MAEVYERVRSYEVSVWPEEHADNIDATAWCVSVAYRGHGKWAVVRGSADGGPVLRHDGNWVRERIPSSRDDDWLAEHRYSLDEALVLARWWAPRVRINGMTATGCLARHLKLPASDSRTEEPGA